MKEGGADAEIISEWSEDQHQRRELPGENRDGDREHRIHLQGIHAHLQQVRRGLFCIEIIIFTQFDIVGMAANLT